MQSKQWLTIQVYCFKKTMISYTYRIQLSLLICATYKLQTTVVALLNSYKVIKNITNEGAKKHDIVQMWLSELFLLL